MTSHRFIRKKKVISRKLILKIIIITKFKKLLKKQR